MGTHGRGALANLLLGSIMNKVVHLAQVPVTIVQLKAADSLCRSFKIDQQLAQNLR